MTDDNQLKACATCIYCDGSDLFLYCTNPSYSYETKDYIYGRVHTNHSLCVMVRDNENLCGDLAKGWKENPNSEPEYYPSLWSALKGAFKGLFR